MAASVERGIIMAKCTGVLCRMPDGYKVDECDCKGCPCRTEPITNADRIRSMSDFELAKEIENAQSGIEIDNPKKIDYFDCILEWLQQHVE